MANNLVIAEKPSVAQSIAKVLGCTDKQDGYLSGGGYLVSWCIGHLVELANLKTMTVNMKPGRRKTFRLSLMYFSIR